MINSRITTIQKNLQKNKIDALLIANPHNILYFTGFKTMAPEEREAFLFITKKSSVIITDRRYKPEFESVLYVSKDHRLTNYLHEISKKEKVKRIGIEGDSLTVSEYKELSKKLFPLKVVVTLGIVQNLRKVKDREEIQKIRKACKLADKCLYEIAKTIRMGQTEKEIALRMEFWIKERGYEMSFYPIVAVDSNSAVPHYDTRGGKGIVGKNSLILIDMGVKYRDYCSDITRMFVAGTPTSRQKNIHEQLLDAQQKTVEFSKTTKEARKIDMFCRNLVEQKGLKNFNHSTGHGIGLEVHESLSISFRSKAKIKEGMVFTIEPGVYYEGEFGFRIEDTVIKTKKGIEILTKFPKKLQKIA